jgi:hypothetical protein
MATRGGVIGWHPPSRKWQHPFRVSSQFGFSTNSVRRCPIQYAATLYGCKKCFLDLELAGILQ